MRVAMILSGCGVRDGSEIHESVCASLALQQSGHSVEYYAPDRLQTSVFDHAHGFAAKESRNILCESARIARGQIQALSKLVVSRFDAVVFPGGMGAALNLSSYGYEGAQCTVSADVSAVVQSAHQSGVLLGFMCIAPVIAARLIPGARLTVGALDSTAEDCQKMGAQMVACREDEACIDEKNRIVTVPAYMKAQTLVECMKSAQALVEGLESLKR